MRFLALQTDIRELKKQFLVEGEEEILTTAHHPIGFMVETFVTTLVMIVVAVFFVWGLIAIDETISLLILIGLFVAIALFYSYRILRSYIDWHYDFLIVTTEKVVIIDHAFVFYQHVNPVHIDNIASTRFESQFFGILKCGRVHISLKEREGGTTREIVLNYIPQPDVVASAIENAIALEKQRSQHQDAPEQQLSKIQEVQQKIEESVQKEPVAPTVQPPEEPVTRQDVQEAGFL